MKVSVLIPTHNRAKLLRRAVESIFRQSFNDIECIIVDDHSTDETEKISLDLISKYKKIRYIKYKGVRNLQAVLNIGLTQSQGEYIARLDDDDLWTDENKLLKQVSFLDDNPDYFLVGTNANFFDVNGELFFSSRLPEIDSELRQKALLQNNFLASTVLFNKEKALKFCGFMEDVKLAGDYGLWLGLGSIGKFANLSDVTTNIYLSQNEIKQRRIIRTIDSMKIIKIFRKDYSSYLLGLVVRWVSMLVLYLSPQIFDRFLYQTKNVLFKKKGV